MVFGSTRFSLSGKGYNIFAKALDPAVPGVTDITLLV
ncbi:hypothetical protein DESHY_40021 [Desulforamulus hydrothermalis Lam5 = DSM 18033]|uniref:Uncharacterized protein n=1 Tax=Desulforamulus hydrothermalis Lam5 = DSM 18033 TaxID=1121428 RepID=K8EIN8_9FIRM|nr:hypothetical protein DESHY_40021 [Desulforamulus hydrothermalis Lam5 = DSM 18033]